MWTISNWLEKHNIDSMLKIIMKDVGLGEPPSFLEHENLLLSKSVSSQQGYCGELQRYVRIQFFCWSQGHTIYQSFRETRCRSNIFVVIWHGKSCKEMSGKIFRVCSSNDSTLAQSCKLQRAIRGWPPIWRRTKWMISWRSVYSLHNLFWNVSVKLVLGDLIFCGL